MFFWQKCLDIPHAFAAYLSVRNPLSNYFLIIIQMIIGAPKRALIVDIGSG